MEKKKLVVLLIALVVIMLGATAYCLLIGNEYPVVFNTMGGSKIETVYVQTGKKVEQPEDPTREGYRFIEWQLGDKKYDFDKKVTKKMTLKAKWQKLTEEITCILKFDSKGGSEVAAQSIKAGDKATKPQDPTKEGATFLGWYLNGQKYNFDKTILQDVTLVASWSDNKVVVDYTSDDLKVGDSVKITGAYASSSDAKESLHTKAIGWTRVILAVYPNREYPYQIGNSTGTTGFFQAASLQKLN